MRFIRNCLNNGAYTIRRTGLNDGLVSDAKLDSGVGTQAVLIPLSVTGAVTTLKLNEKKINTGVIRDGAITPPKIDTTATFKHSLQHRSLLLSVTGKVSRDDASGTDVSGSDITIAGGAGTGAASGGFIRLKTAVWYNWHRS